MSVPADAMRGRLHGYDDLAARRDAATDTWPRRTLDQRGPAAVRGRP